MEPEVMVADQIHLLRQHGFIGFLDNNPEGLLLFKEELQTLLSDMKRYDEHNPNQSLENYEPLLFHQHLESFLIGKIGQPKKDIAFNFHYDYDPIGGMLNLNKVHVWMMGAEIELPIKEPGDLWPAKEFYERLKPFSEILTAARKKGDVERFFEQMSDSLKRQQKLLFQRGYVNADLLSQQRPGHLSRQLQHRFYKTLDKLSGVRDCGYFHVKFKTLHPQTRELVNHKIHYRVNTLGPALVPQSITTLAKDGTRVTDCRGYFGLPLASDLYGLQRGDPEQKKAYEILNKRPKTTHLKIIVSGR